MIEEAFAGGDSIPHRLDPRLKIVFTVLFSFWVALSSHLAVLSAALLCAILLAALAQLPPAIVFKRLGVINFFNLLLWLILPLTFEGDVFHALGRIKLTTPGILLALHITLKSNTILLVFIALITTSHLSAIGHALETLRMPEKLVHLLMISYRYVFVLEQEYRRLVNAARMRNFRPGTNMHTYKTYAYLFGMLIVKASARADRVYQAMLCRGFHGKFYCLNEFKYSRTDLIATVLMTIFLVMLGWLQWAGKGRI